MPKTPFDSQTQQTVKTALGIIKSVPFTRMVALTGSYAEGCATKTSDIDFFIQVKPGHIFSTRFFVTLFLQWAGIRRTNDDIAGKICLNWFATYDAPAQQKGRVYEVLWSESKPSKMKPICEYLFSLFLLNWVEKLTKQQQIARFERDPRTHLPGSQVRYSDTELGFHPPKAAKNVKST